MPLQNVEAHETRRWSGRSGEPGASGVEHCTDKNGKEYEGYKIGDGRDTWIEIYLKGTNLGWRVDAKPDPPNYPVGNNKVDDFSMKIVRYNDGRVALRVKPISHWANQPPGQPTPSLASEVDILGTGAVYDPDNPEHGDNAVPIVAQPVEGGGEVTPEQIQTIIEGTVAAIREEFGGDIRRGIRDKCRDAVLQLNMSSPSMQNRGVDQWARDRVYEVLRDQGLIDNQEVQDNG